MHAGSPPAPPAEERSELPVYAYRARFGKTGPSRFLSQLELSRALARAFRRARVPLAYSQGFHPLPRISFGPALAVGIASEAEFMDFEAHAFLRPEEFIDRVNALMPRGLRIQALVPLSRGCDSLSKAINRVLYRARIPAPLLRRAVSGAGQEGTDLAEEHGRAVADLMARTAIPYRRRRETGHKDVDLRPFLISVSAGEADISLELSMDNGRTARPHEVLDVLYGEGSREVPVTRLDQFVVRDGRVLSPLLAAGDGRLGARDPR
jgi:radical SAM-linked protein